jgi:hypothetical protein
MRPIDDLMTPTELCNDLFSYLPADKLKMNIVWLNQVFGLLEHGGLWVWPGTQRTFQKISEAHFMEVSLTSSDEEE